MNEFIVILKNVILFVALAMPGYILVKTKILKSTDSGALSKLLTYVGMPFLIFYGILDVEFNAEFLLTAGISAGLFILVLVAIYILSVPLTANYKKTNPPSTTDDITLKRKRGLLRFCMVFSNNGFLGIPLAMAVFPKDGAFPLVLPILIIMNLLQNLITLDVGGYLVSGGKASISIKKTLINPILIAFIVGVILNVTNVIDPIPEIKSFAEHLKNLVTPVSMVILGMKLADIKILQLFTDFRTYYVSFIKLIVLPVIGVSLAILATNIFNLSNELILATFIAFAMPTAGLASTLADQHNGDTEGAVICTLGSTMLSVATIPLLYLALTFII